MNKRIVDREGLKLFLLTKAKSLLIAKGIEDQVPNEHFNYIEAEVLDSIGFIELLEEIEKNFSIEMNLQNIDPTQFTSVKGILDHVAPEDDV